MVAESVDGSDFIRLRDITVTGEMATLNGVHPPLSYHLRVFANHNQTSNGIVLPSVSESSTIEPGKLQLRLIIIH